MSQNADDFDDSKLQSVRDLFVQRVWKIKCPCDAASEKLMRYLHDHPEVSALRVEMIRKTGGRYFPMREFFDREGDILLLQRTDLLFRRFRFRFEFLEMISPSFVAQEACKYKLIYSELSSDFWRMSTLDEFLIQMREWKLMPRPEKRWWKVSGRWELCDLIGDSHYAW